MECRCKVDSANHSVTKGSNQNPPHEHINWLGRRTICLKTRADHCRFGLSLGLMVAAIAAIASIILNWHLQHGNFKDF